MMHIYICDDNPIELDIIEQIVNDYLAFHSEIQKPVVNSFSNPYVLLDSISQQEEMNIYLLDIDLKCDLDGITTATQIRQKDPRGFIIFITTHDECIPLTFQNQVEALGYIIKGTDDFREQLMNTLARAFSRYKDFYSERNVEKPTKIKVKIGTGHHYVHIDNLIYAQTSEQQHRVKLYTTTDYMEYYGSLAELKKSLTDDFFCCHRSTIVNLRHVTYANYSKKYLLMDNGHTVPISYTKIESFKKHFT